MADTMPPVDSNEPAEAAPLVYQSRAVRVSIVGTFLILLAGAFYYARGFVLPLFLALLVTLSFAPVVRHFSRRGIPAAATAGLIVLAMAGGLAGASVFLADPVTRMVEAAPQFAASLRQRFEGMEGPLAKIAAARKQIDLLADGVDPDAPQKVVLAQPGILSWAADTLSGIGGTIGATLILAVFLLASGDMFLQKLIRIFGTLSDKKKSLRIVHDVEYEVSRYLLTITVINAGLGIAVGFFMWVFGMPSPILWGVGAALLNYIPYLGAFTGIVLAGAVAFVTFPTLGMAALPPAAYLICNIIEGTFVTPLVLGRRLELNTVAILIALAFAGWMWGVVGAIIAVPLLVIVKVFCDHFPNLAHVGEFLSAAHTEPPGGSTNGDTPAS
jgi:predicted PurR-regulated permease PerM